MKVLGWDPAKKDGVFVGDFNSIDKGKDIAKSMVDEGADVILPVAGKVGQGPAALATELGADKLKIIGVDTDQYATDPEHKGVFLSSVLKKVDSTTQTAVTEAFDGSFKGGVIQGDLKNGGVDLAPFHDFDSAVPAELKDELPRSRPGSSTGRSRSACRRPYTSSFARRAPSGAAGAFPGRRFRGAREPADRRGY